jgi:oligopeptide/dipeptide ABC transporter ATP-binding protein
VVSQAAILELLATLRHQFQVALLFITHDFAVVSSQADRIAVMYAGRIVEAGPAEAVYRAPRHPYTRGLIRALPNVRGPLRPLVALDGTPPDLSDDLVGCPFAPRCPLADVACASYEPRLVAVGPGHEAACRKAGLEEAG